MTLIPWSGDGLQSYLRCFQIGTRLTHPLGYFSPEAGQFLSAQPSLENARLVGETALSFFKHLGREEADPHDELICDIGIGTYRQSFCRPAFSSTLIFETNKNIAGVTLGIRHVLDYAGAIYVSSGFSIGFSGDAWSQGLGDYLRAHEHDDYGVIVLSALRQIGISENIVMSVLISQRRESIATVPASLVPGGPEVVLRFDRLRSKNRPDFTHIEVSVDGIHPLTPYLPGGILHLWRMAEAMAG